MIICASTAFRLQYLHTAYFAGSALFDFRLATPCSDRVEALKVLLVLDECTERLVLRPS